MKAADFTKSLFKNLLTVFENHQKCLIFTTTLCPFSQACINAVTSSPSIEFNSKFDEQFDNIFLSIIASDHKCSQSLIVFCIEISGNKCSVVFKHCVPVLIFIDS